MMKNSYFPAALILLCACAPCLADTAPFGVASAFNVVALGQGTTPGNISDNADIQGRIAAANLITKSTTIGSNLAGNDPFGSLADGYAIVAGAGITASNSFNINGGGNVYAPSNTASYNWNENPRGSLVKTGGDPINFSALSTTLDALSLQLSALATTGVVGAPTPKNGNPSWFVLSGASTTLNVFTITAAEFANPNRPLDIQVPVGSTVIINVLGAADTLGAGIYFNGIQESDSNDDGGKILFNFAGAATVTIDGQLDGSILAPLAYLSGNSQMGGNFIAAEVGSTGELHYDAFDGALPPSGVTPEPLSLLLLGTGLATMAAVQRIRVR